MKNIYHSSNGNSHQKRWCTAGLFTLIEILVVVGIMLALMAIMLPAFDDMASNNGLRTGIREFSQVLKLARAYAISNREYVAVVMPMVDKNSNGFPSQSDSGIADKYYNRAYRVCVVDEDKNFKHWINGEPWRTLPVGIVFVSEDAPGTAKLGLMTQNPLRVKKVDFSDLGGNQTDENIKTAGISFSPGGRFGAHARYFVLLGEGTYSGGKVQFTNLDPLAAATSDTMGSRTWVTVSINAYGHISYLGSPYGSNDEF